MRERELLLKVCRTFHCRRDSIRDVVAARSSKTMPVVSLTYTDTETWIQAENTENNHNLQKEEEREKKRESKK